MAETHSGLNNFEETAQKSPSKIDRNVEVMEMLNAFPDLSEYWQLVFMNHRCWCQNTTKKHKGSITSNLTHINPTFSKFLRAKKNP